MKRRIVSPIVAALALCACQKASDSRPNDEPAPEPVAAAQPAPSAPPAEEKPAPLDDASLTAYESYMKVIIASAKQHLTELAHNANEAGKGTGAAMAALSRSSAITKQMSDDQEKARNEAHLTPAAVTAWDEITSSIAISQAQIFPQMDTVLAQQKKSLESVPAEQRPQAEASLKAMEEQFASQRHFDDLRKKFGDAAVDAALKRSAELKQLMDERMSVLADMQKAANDKI